MYVEYNLMKKNDKESCKVVNEFLKTDISNFWKKAKIICLIAVNAREFLLWFSIDFM